MSSYNIPDIIFTDCLIASASGIYIYDTTFLLKLRPSASVAAAHIFQQLKLQICLLWPVRVGVPANLERYWDPSHSAHMLMRSFLKNFCPVSKYGGD